MGKLIVIEGTDSSGKQTQTEKVYNKLLEEGYKVKRITFPDYEIPSSAPVKMYLSGELGQNPQDVNVYAVSSMYAIDRFISFTKNWKDFYEEGGIIISDRYTMSNMIHQASKIEDLEEKKKYVDWLYDLEFEKMKIPFPDLVIFLNMPTEFADKLMESRLNKFSNEEEKDIHEKNKEYMKKSYDNALYMAENYNWKKIDCVKEENIKSIENISEEIFALVNLLHLNRSGGFY